MSRLSFDAAPVSLLLLILVSHFFLCRIGTLPQVSHYHGDETWYTDAAIQMLQTGDYTTPRYADGSPRFRKPIFAYWIILGSYKIFGVNLLSSRLPFLLAGCLLMLATFFMAQSVLREPKAALLAAALLGSNIEVMDWSVVSHPDMYQALFLTSCLWGLAEVVLRNNMNAFSYALIYLGAGLATATKGLLGLVAWIYGLVFLVAARRRKVSELIPPQWALLGAVLCFSWFAVALYQHGTAVILDFSEDQARGKVSTDLAHIAQNFIVYFTGPVRWFFPWTLLIIAAVFMGKRPLWESFRQNQNVKTYLPFAGWWFILIVSIFSLGIPTKARYLLPAYPLIACVAAYCLCVIDRHERSSAITMRLGKALLTAGAICGGIFTILGIGWDDRLLLGGSVILVCAAVLLAMCRHQRVFGVSFALALFITTAYSVYNVWIHPVFRFSPTPEIAEELYQVMPHGGTVGSIDLQRKFLGQLRVMLGGRFTFQSVGQYPSSETITAFPVLLVSDDHIKAFDPRLFLVKERGRSSQNLTFEEAWTAFQGGTLKHLLSQSVRRYYIVQPLLPPHVSEHPAG